MKKLIFTLLLGFFAMNSISAQGNCDPYLYLIDLNGFVCGNDPGNICFVTSANWTHYNTCGGYVVELEYPTGSFIYTDLDEFYLHSQNQSLTVLRHQPSFVSEGLTIGCLEGVLQVPNTVFTIRIVWPSDPNDVLSTTTFTLDAFKTIGGSNQTTLLSDAITNGDLLPAAQAASQGQTIVIEGTLVIDEDYLLGASPNGGVKNEILLAPGARIEVGTSTQGVDLGTFMTDIEGCDDTWDRILVRPGSTYSGDFTNIKDATVAIELMDQCTLLLARVFLTDNEIGIGTFGTAQKDVQISLFTSIFEGITIQNGTEGAHFENTRLVDFSGNLRIQNMTANGVYLDRSDFIGLFNSYRYCPIGINVATENNLLEIDRCSFEHGNVGVLSMGSAEMEVVNSTFLYLLTGIGRASKILNEHTLIEYNVMAECNNNILAIPLQSRAEIQFNDLSAEFNNVAVWAMDDGLHRWAIQHSEALVAGVQNNDGHNVKFLGVRDGRIFKNDVTLASLRNIAVEGGRDVKIGYNINLASFEDNIQFGPSPAGLIYCNTTDGNTGLIFLNNSSGTIVRGNEMSSSGHNLSYGTTGNVFAHTGPQPYRGNMFDASSPTNPKAVNFSIEPIAAQNRYTAGFLADAQGTALYPYFESADNDWFTKNENGNDYICPPGLTGTDTIATTLKREIEGHIGLLSANVAQFYGDEVAFDARLKLFRALEMLNQIQTLDTMQQAWYNSLENSSVAPFIAFEQLYQTAGTLSPSAAAAVEVLVQEIKELKEFLPTIVWYTLGDTVAINTAKKAIYDSKIAEIKTKTAILSDSLQSRHQLLLDQWSTLNALNEGISTTSMVPAQNLKAVNRLLLHRLSPSFEGYTETQLDTLQSIAEQCFGTGGEAVFKARALLAETTWSFEAYDDECIENPTEELTSTASSRIARWNAFPNPAKDLVTVTLPENHGWQALTVHDMLGREVARIQLTEGQASTSIQTVGLSSGFYFIAPLGKKEQTLKLVVKH